jgi:hypothetical protein
MSCASSGTWLSSNFPLRSSRAAAGGAAFASPTARAKAHRGQSEPEAQLGQFVAAETARGIELVIADHGEIDEVEARILRRARYTEEQVFGDRFPEEPRG